MCKDGVGQSQVKVGKIKGKSKHLSRSERENYGTKRKISLEKWEEKMCLFVFFFLNMKSRFKSYIGFNHSVLRYLEIKCLYFEYGIFKNKDYLEDIKKRVPAFLLIFSVVLILGALKSSSPTSDGHWLVLCSQNTVVCTMQLSL